MSQHPPVTERAEALIVYIQVDQSALLLRAGSGPRTVYLTAFQLKPPNRLKQKKNDAEVNANCAGSLGTFL